VGYWQQRLLEAVLLGTQGGPAFAGDTSLLQFSGYFGLFSQRYSSCECSPRAARRRELAEGAMSVDPTIQPDASRSTSSRLCLWSRQRDAAFLYWRTDRGTKTTRMIPTQMSV
jgi:hypothetical protein